jgi:hypothetical protein
MPAGELRGRDARRNRVEKPEEAIGARTMPLEDRAVHDFVEQHGEVEHRKALHDGQRDPDPGRLDRDQAHVQAEQQELPRRAHEVAGCRPAVERLERLARDRAGEVGLQLVGVLGVVVRRGHGPVFRNEYATVRRRSAARRSGNQQSSTAGRAAMRHGPQSFLSRMLACGIPLGQPFKPTRSARARGPRSSCARSGSHTYTSRPALCAHARTPSQVRCQPRWRRRSLRPLPGPGCATAHRGTASSPNSRRHGDA